MWILAAALAVLTGIFFLWLRRATRTVKHVDVGDLRNLKDVPQDTLFALLQSHLVSFETIRARGYGPALEVVQLMLGVVPTCDVLLEIWPPAFQAYNVIGPNFLNIPELFLGLGTRPKSLITLAMYASSRAAECAYCTAHTCTIALRRGTAPGKLRRVSGVLSDDAELSPAERAVVSVASSLGRVPCDLTADEVTTLQTLVAKADVEWVVASVAMFGFFNKLMDGLGVPLEPETVAETADLMGPTWSAGKAGQLLGPVIRRVASPKVDDWRWILKVLFLGLKPGGLLAIDRRLLRGMPTRSIEASAFLQRTMGCPFPVLGHLTHSRFICALTAIISLNFDDSTTAGLTSARKVLVGAVAADTMQDSRLLEEMVMVGTHFGVERSLFDEAVRAQSSADPLTAITLQAAKALGHSPVRVTTQLVSDLRKSDLTPAMLVEIVSVVACMQMLHRVESVFFCEQ